jgi:hypothetical protein
MFLVKTNSLKNFVHVLPSDSPAEHGLAISGFVPITHESRDCFAALAMTGFGHAGCGFVIARRSGRGNLGFGPVTRKIEIASLRSQ